MKRYFLTLIFALAAVLADAESKVAPNDRDILIEGAMNLTYTDGKMLIDRFSKEMWERDGLNNFVQKKAFTQSGVRIVFRTDSRVVKPLFTDREGADHRKMTNFYGIFRNGIFVGDFNGAELILESDGSVTEWEIVLPIYYGVDFTGLLIDDGARMFRVKREKKPVYVAIGDSITHGAGQERCGSNGTYPFVLAAANGYSLYNLAVGGSQISPAIALELEGIRADIITVLWGYNDWNGLRGDIGEISRRYEKLISELRRIQPEARIYCIMPTASSNESGTGGKKGRSPGCPLDDVRDAERRIVNKVIAEGDRNLFIIEGNTVSSVEDLKGAVHFNNEGAERFGATLAALVK